MEKETRVTTTETEILEQKTLIQKKRQILEVFVVNSRVVMRLSFKFEHDV